MACLQIYRQLKGKHVSNLAKIRPTTLFLSSLSKPHPPPKLLGAMFKKINSYEVRIAFDSLTSFY